MHYTTVRLPGFAPRTASFLDIPVGDPYGGPAYGQKLKGKGMGMVLGVVAAVATGGAGLAAWGAASAAAGATGMTMAHLAAGAMVAGGVMSGVGAITGNKKLSQIGGVLGLAGGVGASFMDSAGNLMNPMAEGAGKSLMGEATTSFNKSIGESFDKVMGKSATKATDLTPTGGAISLDAPSSQMNTLAAQDAAFGGLQGETMSALGQKGTLQLQDAGMGMGVNGLSPETASAAATGTNSVGTVAGAPSPSQNKGIIGNVIDFAKAPGGGNVIAGGLKMIGDGMGASVQEDALQRQFDLIKDRTTFERANLNAKFEYIDPSDPMLEQKKQAARQNGAIPIAFGLNQNSGPVVANGVTSPANQIVAPNQVKVGV